MCTNFVFIKTSGSAELADRLKIDPTALSYAPDIRPASRISIITGNENSRSVASAIWWLYLRQTSEGLRPHPTYFSVNSNYKKLHARPEYRSSRCIIPATAFVESQGGKAPHQLEPADGSALAFGGLYKTWTDRVTGEVVHSAAIITLAGHPALENIHRKSTPLWLPEESYDQWLDPNVSDTSLFEPLLTPALRTPLSATPIDKVTTKNPIGESFIVG